MRSPLVFLLVFVSNFVSVATLFEIDSCEDNGDPCTIIALTTSDGNETIYEPIDVDSNDFSKFSRKLQFLNGTYTLQNSTLKTLPRSSLLTHIHSHTSIVITGNSELTYVDELPSLKYVKDRVVIKNNPSFRLYHELFQKICLGEGSECDVDVICKTNVYINKNYIIGLRPDCTIIEGDLVVMGLLEEPIDAVVTRLRKVKGVIGSIRLYHNEINHFEFLENVQFIEHERGGCGLDVHTNVNLTHLGLKGLERVDLKGNPNGLVFCTRNNLLSGKEKFYLHSENKVDNETMTALESFGPFEVDPVAQNDSLAWAKPEEYDMTAVYMALTGGLCFLVIVVVYGFWILDWRYKLYFYTKGSVVRKQTRAVRKKKPVSTTGAGADILAAATEMTAAARATTLAVAEFKADLRQHQLGAGGVSHPAVNTPATRGPLANNTIRAETAKFDLNRNESTYLATRPPPRGGLSVYVKK